MIRCGIPEEVADSDRRWCYVLLHGDDELETGWNPNWVSREQAMDLLDFLDRELPDVPGYDLVDALRRRLAINSSDRS